MPITNKPSRRRLLLLAGAALGTGMLGGLGRLAFADSDDDDSDDHYEESANTSFAIKNLLDALGVDHETHATGHSWGKGGVEQGNNLVETHFESRLRFEPVESVEQLKQWRCEQREDFKQLIQKLDSVRDERLHNAR